MTITIAIIGTGKSVIVETLRKIIELEAREIKVIILADALDFNLGDIPPGTDKLEFLERLEVVTRMDAQRYDDEYNRTYEMEIEPTERRFLISDNWDWLILGKSPLELLTEKEAYRYTQPIYISPGRITHHLRPFRAARSFRNKREGAG